MSTVAIKEILVATDLGVASEVALLYGRTLARHFGARLHVLHVLDRLAMRADRGNPDTMVAGALQRLEERLTDDDRQALRVTAVARPSNTPAGGILSYARSADVDLIVMGTHGRQGIHHALLGSVAERVVRLSPCPVLTVQHPEREFVLADSPEPDARITI